MLSCVLLRLSPTGYHCSVAMRKSMANEEFNVASLGELRWTAIVDCASAFKRCLNEGLEPTDRLCRVQCYPV